VISPYRPRKSGQYEPVDSFSAYDCVAAVTAMLVDRATCGRLRVTHSRIRQLSGVTVHRGLLLIEAEAAAKKLGVQLERRGFDNPNTRRGQLMNLVASGRGVGIIIDTNVTYGTPYATNSFRGLHLVFLNQYAWRQQEKPHAVFITEDPGTTHAGYLEWPADLMYRAAETAGNGTIYTIATLDTEGVTRTARVAAPLKTAPKSTAPTKGQVKAGESRKVVRTLNGGEWANGAGYGWHQLGNGLYVRGETFA
jgi:hypothetical protein